MRRASAVRFRQGPRIALLASLAVVAACAPATPPPTVAIPVPAAPPPAKEARPALRPAGRPTIVWTRIDGVSRVAWSPDGATLAVAGPEGIGLGLVDAASIALRGALREASGDPYWANDGATLLTWAPRLGDPAVHLWNAATGAPKGRIDVQRGEACAISGTHVAVARGDAIQLFDSATAERRGTLAGAGSGGTDVVAVGARFVAAADKAGGVRIWPLEGGAPRVLLEHGERVRELAWSADGRVLAGTLDNKGELLLWDAASGSVRHVEISSGEIAPIEWAPDGTRVGVGATIVRADTLATREVKIPGDHARGLRFSASGKLVVALSDSMNYGRSVPHIGLETIDGGEPHRLGLNVVGPDELDAAFRPGSDAVAWGLANCVGFVDASGGERVLESTLPVAREVSWTDGGRSITARYPGREVRWTLTEASVSSVAEDDRRGGRDADDGDPPPPPGPRRNVLVRAQGRELVLVEDGKKKRVEVVDRGTERATLTIPGVESVLGRTPDGESVVLQRAGAVVIVSARTGKQVTLPIGGARLAFDPLRWGAVGSLVALVEVVRTGPTAFSAKGFSVWDVRKAKSLARSKDGVSPSLGTFGSPPLPAVVFDTASEIVVLDARSGKERLRLPAHGCGHATVAGDRVAATCVDGRKGRIVLWDATHATEVPLPGAPPDGVVPWSTKVGFAPDGSILVGEAERGGRRPHVVWVWDARSGTLVEEAAGPGRVTFAFRQDGRFLLYGDDPVTVLRLADRKRLHLGLSANAPIAFTEDGLYDGEPAALASVRVRVGDDLLHGDLLNPSQLPQGFGLPGLVAWFLSGGSVDPPPSSKDGVGPPPALTLERVDGGRGLAVRVLDRGGGVGTIRVEAGGKVLEIAQPTSAEREAGVVERTVDVGDEGADRVTAEATARVGGTKTLPVTLAAVVAH